MIAMSDASLIKLILSACRLSTPCTQVHGSAPDIAGQDVANPLAMVLSAAMMCRYGLNMPQVRMDLHCVTKNSCHYRQSPKLQLCSVCNECCPHIFAGCLVGMVVGAESP